MLVAGNISSTLICPHLKGSSTGAMCNVVTDYVRNIVDVNIKFCMSQRFEICHVYRTALKEEDIYHNEFSC